MKLHTELERIMSGFNELGGDVITGNPSSPDYTGVTYEDIELEAKDLQAPDRVDDLWADTDHGECWYQILDMVAKNLYDECDIGRQVKEYVKTQAQAVAQKKADEGEL